MSRSCKMGEGYISSGFAEPLRFLVVGVLNTAFGYMVFATLMLLGAAPGLALVAAAAAGAAFNFQTLRRLVFRKKGRWVRFLATYVVLLGLNWGALRLARMYGVSEIYAQALLSLPVAALSYLCHKVFVFRETEGAV
jgi:putative flippase GtrA